MDKVAVTGATGFLADELIKSLVNTGIHVNAIARNESKLIELKKKYENISIFPCPIEDIYLLKKAIKDCSGVYHLASFKDVILAESHPLKTIQTNIIGTKNLLQLSTEMSNIGFVISTSTDKAVKISGVYGASKMIVETLFHECHSINGDKCKYRLVRYGNVFYSTGSVLVKWKKALLDGDDILLTDDNATRFFLRKEDAVSLIFDCLKNAKTPEPCLPIMKSIEMGNLLNVMIKKYGKKDINIKRIGLQKGENLHELITPELSSFDAERWTEQDLFEIV